MTLLGGAATVGPVAVHAQQVAMPMIGFLSPVSLDTIADQLRGFRRGLKEAGYVEGENVAIEYRSAENQIDRLPGLAAELIRRGPAMIATFSSGAFVAKAATTTIPIVFVIAEDPVRLGLVTSLARPSGNLTGANFVSAELVAKRLGLLRELVPGAARIAVLVNPANAVRAESTLKEVQAAAGAMGLEIEAFNGSTGSEINASFARIARERPDALFISNDPFFSSRRVQVVLYTTRHAIPAAYPHRQYSEIGGLMSYGADIPDAYRQAGVYAGRILKGAKLSDLPVVQSSKFELVINAVTARMLSIDVPPTLLARADEVIE
jgi:putative tryptophan/tyrosine transport system substrate-binding protein